jgi:stage IV sporulation protein FB
MVGMNGCLGGQGGGRQEAVEDLRLCRRGEVPNYESTRMLKFKIFGFPVFIHWGFWLVAALLSGDIDVSSPMGTQRLLGWIAVVFVSILIHELGHAATMRHYGDQRVLIHLHSFGGFALGSRHLTRGQNILMSSAGPFVQIAAGVAMWWAMDQWPPRHWLAHYMMEAFIRASIFWALLNLLPIVPLDGGRISLAVFGPRREKMALILSLLCAAVLAVIAISYGRIYPLVVLAMLAVSNVKRLRGRPDDAWMGTR